MSFSAYNWARELTTLKSSTLKTILKCLADFENGRGEAWCTIPTFVRYTDLDRKTVIAGLAELERRGVIADTGKRVGSTGRTTVYRLLGGFVPDSERTPEVGNGPENGTIQHEQQDSPATGAQVVDSPETSDAQAAAGAAKREWSQKRNDSKNGMIPNLEGNSPVFSGQWSQKRDSNSDKPSKTQDARAPARTRARGAAPVEPPQPDPEQRRRYWANRWLNDVLREVWFLVPRLDRLPLASMPGRIPELVQIEQQRFLEEWGNAEPRTAAEDSVTQVARATAKRLASLLQPAEKVA
jgi:hypothetical protein